VNPSIVWGIPHPAPTAKESGVVRRDRKSINLLIGQETLAFRVCRAAFSRKGPRRSIRSSDFNSFILQFVEDFSHIPSLPVDGHEQTGRRTHHGGKVDAAGPETRNGVHVGSRLRRPPCSAPASREKCPAASVRIVPLRSRRLGS
jgi:hypothetical protein